MGSVSRLFFASAMVLAGAASASAQAVDYSNSPVLCAYKFMAKAYEVGRLCYPKRDKNFVTAMEKSVALYRDFVKRNMPETDAKADYRHRQYRAWVHKTGFAVIPDIETKLCDSIRQDAKQWYNTEIIQQKASIQSIVKTTNAILAKDRKPLETGC